MPSTGDMWKISSFSDFTMQGVLVQKGHLGIECLSMATLMDRSWRHCHYDSSEKKGEVVEVHKEKRGENSTVITGCGTIKKQKHRTVINHF